MECELCRVMCMSVLQMRDHLRTEQHMIKERQLFTDPVENQTSTLALR